jgi:hypothetical protein
MVSLESKLGRLSQEQQQEVEDFVDFLLKRNGEKPVSWTAPLESSEIPAGFAPPPLTVQESSLKPLEEQIDSPAPGQDQQLVSAGEYQDPMLIQEIADDPGNASASEYLDYGIFEQPSAAPSSPATEAVQRVKGKLSAKKGKDPAGTMLDWID